MYKKYKFLQVFFVVSMTALALSACNMPTRESVNPLPPGGGEPADSQELDEELPAPTATPQIIDTVSPTNTPEPTVEHLTQPGEPTHIRTWISDLSSAAYAPEHRAIGDNLNVNLLERPFTANEMTYQPYLDLIKTEVGEGGEWIYIVLSLEGELPQESEAFYAVEIDLDRDGRGDWLIGATSPASAEWTTDGVEVWHDSNNDVGGLTPIVAEAPLSGIDGYDQLIFEAGHGDDPDAAWVRRDPTSAKRVQLAFKHSLIDSASTFLWGGWSDEGVREPGWFDYNDHFTLAEAGSPLINNDHYPLAALFSVDNTCRWSYGFEPDTAYPGLCPLPTPTPTPTNTPAPEETTPPEEDTPEPPTEEPDICPPPASYHCENWNYETCECEDETGCQPPEGGCGDNSEWVPEPDCYCAPY